MGKLILAAFELLKTISSNRKDSKQSFWLIIKSPENSQLIFLLILKGLIDYFNVFLSILVYEIKRAFSFWKIIHCIETLPRKKKMHNNYYLGLWFFGFIDIASQFLKFYQIMLTHPLKK